MTHVHGGRSIARGAVALVVSLVAASSAVAADLDTAIDLEAKKDAEAVQSQKAIDKIDDQTDSMAADYRRILDQLESLRVYNRQLERLLAAQREELDSLAAQIANVTVIGREVSPLMLRMVDALEAFIDLDVPLLLNERHKRVAQLRELMNRADVENSEKYRRIMEAYQIENEYGRTIEAYQDTLRVDGQDRTMDFLRVGRIALLYQTPDGQQAGAWDQKQRTWVQLPSEYRDAIRKGVRIARKQTAPDLIRIPVAAPEEIR